MGYSTAFKLQIHDGNKTVNEIYREWEAEGFDFDGFDYAIDDNGHMCDGVKWYSHEEDMKRLSTLYPDNVFLLTGEGEENADIWYKYFKNGKLQSCYAKITFDEYDENKLR